MQISIQTNDKLVSKKVLEFLASFKKDEIEIKTFDESEKKETFASFAGMWKDRDITVKNLRESAWKE
jgi:hypothetical protein